MRTVALSEVAQVNPRWTPEAKPDDAVSFVGMANLSDERGRVVAEEQRRVREVRTGYTPFLANDLLVAKITPCFENGKIGKATISETYGAGSTEFHVVRPGAELDGRYALHFLRRPHFRAAGELRMTGSGGQRRVPADYVAGTKIPLPSMDEQHRIADILDKADALRAKRRAAIAHLDALSQSIFHEMFGDPLENPKGARVKELAELIDPQRPVTYGILMPGPDQPQGVKYVRVTDIQGGRIRQDTVRSTTDEIAAKYQRSALRPGDLLMSIRGHVGRFALVPAWLDGANITQDTARLAIVGAYPTYVRECLSMPSFQHWMARHTKGVAVRGINLGDVRKMPIPVPAQEHQRAFDERVRSVEKLKSAHRAQLDELDNLFRSLQDRAFKGEL
ncbi:restriction endonuclease subunit S [uncultured Citricoccus sp.]|uniref:restriction endonuclease subunit S n=1 Tax=uncultured Citricoccus sp. TaxID=614031 RepID=UPI00260AE6C8|nr:restriction endonuclease subunit S [uncultured Citricoccus sp.]